MARQNPSAGSRIALVLATATVTLAGAVTVGAVTGYLAPPRAARSQASAAARPRVPAPDGVAEAVAVAAPIAELAPVAEVPPVAEVSSVAPLAEVAPPWLARRARHRHGRRANPALASDRDHADRDDRYQRDERDDRYDDRYAARRGDDHDDE